MGFADKQNTAVLFFHRSATVESDVKSYTKNSPKRNNKQIAAAFNQYTLQQIQRSGFCYFIANYKQEQGLAFGKSLSNAIQTVFDQGFEKVIAVGNDCPELTSVKIQNAAKKIGAKQIVLGPTFDGGVYLIGIHKKSFKAEKFTHLGWNSNQLQHNLVEYVKQINSAVTWEKQLLDIDLPQQLETWLSQHKISHRFAVKLASLLSDFKRNDFALIQSRNSPDVLKHRQLRAPPALH